MRVKGKITEWNDVRGFGFVTPLKGGERAFFHISHLLTSVRRPTEGEFVSYKLGTDEQGRLRATEITYVVIHAKRAAVISRTPASLIAGCVAATFLGVIVVLASVGRLWWPIACVYIVASIVTYFEYKHDKEAARVRERRTNEWTLIILGLIGGWPGALVARHRFRHKTMKIPFRIGYWLSVTVNVVGLAWLIAETQG